MNDELRMKNFEVKIYNILGEKILQHSIFSIRIMNDELRMKNFEVKIYNILGEKILQPRSTQIGVASASLQPHSTFSIDISNQPQGIYFYQIRSGEKTYSGKLVKE